MTNSKRTVSNSSTSSSAPEDEVELLLTVRLEFDFSCKSQF